MPPPPSAAHVQSRKVHLWVRHGRQAQALSGGARWWAASNRARAGRGQAAFGVLLRHGRVKRRRGLRSDGARR